MIDEHTEIEAKMDAIDVSTSDFLKWMFKQPNIERYVVISSPDEYYESGDYVVRQRGDDAHHELTVKLRKSDNSTRDRVEIDLKFAQSTTPDDVRAFLKSVGFKKAFTLTKLAHIFWVQFTKDLKVSFVIYNVVSDSHPGVRRFIEVEAEKGSSVTHETAKKHIRNIVKTLQTEFKLGEPMNDSLYEIYSGKKYRTVG